MEALTPDDIPKYYELPEVLVNLLLTQDNLYSPDNFNPFRCFASTPCVLNVDGVRMLLKNATHIFLPTGTVVTHIEDITPVFNFKAGNSHERQCKYTHYYLTDQLYNIQHMPAIDENTATVRGGTTLIPEIGPEKVLLTDTQVTLPDYCPIQILPGTLLQNYNRPDKYIITSESMKVHLHHPSLWEVLWQDVKNIFG
jgi:hypothetical protein